jgi:glycerate 2-kinase
MTTLDDDARSIFHQALAAASIPAAFARRPPDPENKLTCVVAIGKAALPMLEAFPVTPLAGICCAPVLPDHRMPGIDYFTGGHPLPTMDSFAAASAALALLRGLGPTDRVFFLISGGASAMFELPLDQRISLADTRVLYQALVGSGATIAEINTVRKHFSAVKGGRLAAATPAQRHSLLVSDVAPRYLDALASGPTLQDTSTVADCHSVLDRYHLRAKFPSAIQEFFRDPPPTPHLHPAPVETLLSSADLEAAAAAAARALGYHVVTDNDCDDWDYQEAAHHLLDHFRRLRQQHAKVCLLNVGEVTVRLGPAPGLGGRNQQFALACALELAGDSKPAVVLSAGSDGIDGNSPAAGALADTTTVARSQADAADALAGFDAYPFFHALGDTLITGPTHNNLRDLRIFLSGA